MRSQTDAFERAASRFPKRNLLALLLGIGMLLSVYPTPVLPQVENRSFAEEDDREEEPELFFRSFDSIRSPDEKAAAALGKLQNRFPIGSDVTHLINFMSKEGDLSGGFCKERFDLNGKHFYCKYGYVMKPSTLLYHVWVVPIECIEGTDHIKSLKVIFRAY